MLPSGFISTATAVRSNGPVPATSNVNVQPWIPGVNETDPGFAGESPCCTERSRSSARWTGRSPAGVRMDTVTVVVSPDVRASTVDRNAGRGSDTGSTLGSMGGSTGASVTHPDRRTGSRSVARISG